MLRLLKWLLGFLTSKVEEAEKSEEREKESWDKQRNRFKDAAGKWREK